MRKKRTAPAMAKAVSEAAETEQEQLSRIQTLLDAIPAAEWERLLKDWPKVGLSGRSPEERIANLCPGMPLPPGFAELSQADKEKFANLIESDLEARRRGADGGSVVGGVGYLVGQVGPPPPMPMPEAALAERGTTKLQPTFIDDAHRQHVLLLGEVLRRRALPGDPAETVLADWVKEYSDDIHRTSVPDYRESTP